MTTKDTWKAHVERVRPYKTAWSRYIWSAKYANKDVLRQHAASMLGRRAPSSDAQVNITGKTISKRRQLRL